MKLEFSPSIFQEYSKAKFHDEADRRFLQFCERAQKKLDTANIMNTEARVQLGCDGDLLMC
jgi:site-specific DNA-adenine methylase